MNASAIVCATDLSEVSRAALCQAQAAAHWEGSALHVVLTGADTRATPAAADTDAFRSAGGDDRGRHTCVVRTGHPVDAVVEYAREVGAQLIVVGTALPRAGVSKRESIGEMIARRATCPTLVVPTGLRPTREDLPFRNILCAVDLSTGSLAAVEEAIRLVQTAGGTLTLLHVLDELEDLPTLATYAVPEYRQQRMVAAYQRLAELVPPEAREWADIDVQVLTGDAGERILSVAARLRADLIVVGVTPRSRMSRLLLGSASHRVTAEAVCPVLVVPSATAAVAWESHEVPLWRREAPGPRACPPDYVAGTAPGAASPAAPSAGPCMRGGAREPPSR
jgi:nucleotide-binding universal stress UspA family protein